MMGLRVVGIFLIRCEKLRPVVYYLVDTSKVDQARAWMCYASFSGDIEKTAISAKVPADIIRALEHDFDWQTKLRRLKSGAGVSDAEKTANRAVNYLQAQRLRDVLEESLRLLEDPEELVKMLVQFKYTKEGDVDTLAVNPKALLDLTKALESVQNMSYRALGDKLPTQADTVNEKDKGVASSVSSVRDVIAALQEFAAAPAPKTVEAVTDVVP